MNTFRAIFFQDSALPNLRNLLQLLHGAFNLVDRFVSMPIDVAEVQEHEAAIPPHYAVCVMNGRITLINSSDHCLVHLEARTWPDCLKRSFRAPYCCIVHGLHQGCSSHALAFEYVIRLFAGY
jgi:hypothetical protein